MCKRSIAGPAGIGRQICDGILLGQLVADGFAIAGQFGAVANRGQVESARAGFLRECLQRRHVHFVVVRTEETGLDRSSPMPMV